MENRIERKKGEALSWRHSRPPPGSDDARGGSVVLQEKKGFCGAHFRIIISFSLQIQ